MPAKDESLKSKQKAKKELDISKLSKVKNRKIARTFRRKEILKTEAKIVIEWRKLWGFSGILLVATLLLYGTTLFASPTFNDAINIQIKSLAYPTDTLWLQMIAMAQSKPFGGPWVLVSYLWDTVSFPSNVAWYHFVNIMFHAVSCIYLFLFSFQVLFWLKEERRSKLDPYAASLAIAVLFMCQPLAAGSIGYLSGRAGPMACANLMLGLNFFMLGFYATNAAPIIAWYFAAISCFVMGLLCSPQGLGFPFIALGLAAAMKPPRENWKTWFTERWQDFAIFSLAGAAALATLMTQAPSLLDNGVDAPLLSRSNWMLEQASAIVTYFLRYLVFPIGITSNNPTPENLVVPGAVLGAGVIIAFAVFLSRVKNSPLAVFGGMVTIAGLLTNMIFVQHEIGSDQRYYIPLIGAAITAGALLLQRFPLDKKTAKIAIGIAVVLSGITIWRETIWLDNLTFWTNAAKWDPKNARTLGLLSHAKYLQGKVDTALAAKEALKIDPKCAPANEALGLVLVNTRQYHDAVIPLRQAVATAKEQKTVPEKLSIYDAELADAAMRAEDWKTAKEAASEGLLMRPGNAQMHLALGKAYLAEKEPSRAFEEFNIGTQLDKYNPEFLEPTADACLALGSPNYVAFGYTKAKTAAKITQSRSAQLTYIKAALMMNKIPEAKEQIATVMSQRESTAELMFLLHLAEQFDHNKEASDKWEKLAKIKDPNIASKVSIKQVDLTQMQNEMRNYQKEHGQVIPGVKEAAPQSIQSTEKAPVATSSSSSARTSSVDSESGKAPSAAPLEKPVAPAAH